MVTINGGTSTLAKVNVKEASLTTCLLVQYLSSMTTTQPTF
jgi:hypothetical protein